MRMHKGFFVVIVCFFLLFFSSAMNESQAACTPPVQILGDGYAPSPSSPSPIQDAYDYASGTLALPNFTLLLAGEIFTENLFLDRGSVVFDGGYDCSFTTKNATSSIFGTLTVSTGAATFDGINIVSTDQCDFDADLDGFTSIGSCLGSADDCNDNNANVYPGAPEICDGLDNNCDGQVDEGFIPTDLDGDGYYGPGSCGAVADDCNDNDTTIHPNADEIPYDGIDQDCNGTDMTFSDGTSCASCHGILPADWDAVHAAVVAPDGTCAACHATNIASGHYGDRVRTAGNNMTAGSTIVCASCHDQDTFEHPGGAHVVWGKVEAAWPNITCDSCHEIRAAAHMTATAHNNRVIDTSCGVCHTSDTSVLGSRGTGTLESGADVDNLHRSDCTLCHSYTGIVLDAGTVRQAIQQGLNGTSVTCKDCHTDKGANHGDHEHPVEVGPNDLSYDPPGILCGGCHMVANWTEIETIEHNVDTNGTGSCATCHNSPRQEVIDAIALGAIPTNCLDCHADKNLTPHGSVEHVTLGYVTGTTTCLACHDSGVDTNATVIVTHKSNCALCHAAGLALQPGIPAGGGECVTCHTGTWESTHLVAPSHNSLVNVGTTSCADCHNDPPPLTDAADPKVHNACSTCHNAASGALTSLAVGKSFANGGDCTTCHVPDSWGADSSARARHHNVASANGVSCSTCHTNIVPIDDCSSCHGDWWPENAPNLHHETAIKTTYGFGCLDCHALGITSTGSYGILKPAAADCEACHTTNIAQTTVTALHHATPPYVANDCGACHTGI